MTNEHAVATSRPNAKLVGSLDEIGGPATSIRMAAFRMAGARIFACDSDGLWMNDQMASPRKTIAKPKFSCSPAREMRSIFSVPDLSLVDVMTLSREIWAR